MMIIHTQQRFVAVQQPQQKQNYTRTLGSIHHLRFLQLTKIFGVCVMWFFILLLYFASASICRSADRDTAPRLHTIAGRHKGRRRRVLRVSRPGESPVAQTVLAA